MKRMVSLCAVLGLLVGVVPTFTTTVKADDVVMILNFGSCQATQIDVELYTDSSLSTWIDDFYVNGPGTYHLTDYVSAGEAAATNYYVAYYWHNSFYCGSQGGPTQ